MRNLVGPAKMSIPVVGLLVEGLNLIASSRMVSWDMWCFDGVDTEERMGGPPLTGS